MLIGDEQIQRYSYRQDPKYNCDDDQEPVETSEHHRSWGPQQDSLANEPDALHACPDK